MRKIVVLLAAAVVLVSRESAAAVPNLPSHASVELHRDFFRLKFQWSKVKPPNFDAGTAVEFQVQIDPKCFAQPPGGRDDDSGMMAVIHNLPAIGLPYKDVWNYWQPDFWTLVADVEFRCNITLNKLQKAAIWKLGDFTEGKANFAIGLHNADGLNSDFAAKVDAGIDYYFDYRLEVPLDESCDLHPSWGGASVSMQYFPNVCTLPFANVAVSCPEIIGFPHCAESAGMTRFWLQRLCVSTDLYSFVPGAQSPGWGNTSCVDNDGDSVFEAQSLPMFGTNVGDCNDSNPNITTYGYDANTGQCEYLCPVGPQTSCDSGCSSGERCDPYCGVCVLCPSQEIICNDGIDDDCDEKVDCADEDCASNPACGSPPHCGSLNESCCFGPAFCEAGLMCSVSKICVESSTCFDGIQNQGGARAGGSCRRRRGLHPRRGGRAARPKRRRVACPPLPCRERGSRAFGRLTHRERLPELKGGALDETRYSCYIPLFFPWALGSPAPLTTVFGSRSVGAVGLSGDHQQRPC